MIMFGGLHLRQAMGTSPTRVANAITDGESSLIGGGAAIVRGTAERSPTGAA